MATAYQQEVTHAVNTKQAAMGARQAAINARSGIPTPVADQLFAAGEQHLNAGDSHLNAHQPNLAADEYATAHSYYSQAVADAENKRAQLAADAAAAAAAAARAAAAAQQAAIARQQAAAAAAAAAAKTAQQAAAAKAREQAAQQAKQAAQPVLSAAVQAVQSTPGAIGHPVKVTHPAGEKGPLAHQASPVGAHGGAPKVKAHYPTCYGVKFNATNLAICRALLNEALQIKPPQICYVALMYAAAGESTFSTQVDNGGPLQTTCDMASYNGGRDWAGQARSFLLGGQCFARGAISYSHEYSTAWQIANATEENAIWSQSRGDSYARGGYSTAMLTAEAENTVAYMLPGLGYAPGAGPGISNSGQPPPDTGGVFNLFGDLNWAGPFINLFKYMVGGANEAAHMADQSVANLGRTKYVPPA